MTGLMRLIAKKVALSVALALVVACGASEDDAAPYTEVWIPMPDGVRLAADIYLPDGVAD